LGRVRNAVGKPGTGLTAARPEMRLVVHEQRRTELVREIRRRAAADREPAVVTGGGGVGQQVARQRAAHIDSGADTPSRPRPMVRPTRAASTSQSRACVSGGATSSPIT